MNSESTFSTLKAKFQSCKALIFDFDGTLVDLEKLNFNSFKRTFNELYGLELTNEEYQNYCSGVGSKKAIPNYLAYKGVTDYELKLARRVYRGYKVGALKEDVGKYVDLILGTKEFLSLLESKGYYVSIASSSSAQTIKHILDYFDITHYFKNIFDRESVKRVKPDPEIFNMAIAHSGFKVEECLGFEDSKSGLQSCKASGLYTVGMLNQGWNDTFVYDIADLVIDDYRVCVEVLKSL